MVDAPPDTPPPMALRATELLRQRGAPYEDVQDVEPSPRESGVYPISVRAAAILADAKPVVIDAIEDEIPMSEPPRSLSPSNLAVVLEALRTRT